MLRVVVDPGVLIAGLISPRGTPARMLLRWHDGEFDLVVSRALIGELERVLARPKFSKIRHVRGGGGLLVDPPRRGSHGRASSAPS
ncbi:MAG: putative toxin-antitoxin system toxin component, PIN family [Actinomycetota bacterium]